jgi:Zn-dependent protease
VSEEAPDPFAPTAAAPEPGQATPVEPTPTVGVAEATFGQPVGSALLDAQPVDPHPEKLVGAAFAGGLVAAVFLKGLSRRRHR